MFKTKRGQHIQALINQGLNRQEARLLDKQARSIAKHSLDTVDKIHQHLLHLAKTGRGYMKIKEIINNDH